MLNGIKSLAPFLAPRGAAGYRLSFKKAKSRLAFNQHITCHHRHSALIGYFPALRYPVNNMDTPSFPSPYQNG
ncbi:uncharacterized protein EpC_35780 [Erwinia pyrifoliae Ep1/96]|nr:uncharacterized protein EpC_35780 [Erwinia pyrifoliae Ep1/96]